MRRIASSTSAAPLESSNVTDSIDPSLRTATVTIGLVRSRAPRSRTVSTGVLSWIFRAHVSA
jgi:hypothetical protein